MKSLFPSFFALDIYIDSEQRDNKARIKNIDFQIFYHDSKKIYS